MRKGERKISGDETIFCNFNNGKIGKFRNFFHFFFFFFFANFICTFFLIISNSHALPCPSGIKYTLDIPNEFTPTSKFQSTLGHKVNHNFTNDCRYITLDTPR